MLVCVGVWWEWLYNRLTTCWLHHANVYSTYIEMQQIYKRSGPLLSLTLFGTFCQARAFQVYDILDSQDFLLPQRRQRVWGIASIITGHQSQKEIQDEYKLLLASMRSNMQFPMELNFPHAPTQALQAGRHTKLMQKAQVARPTSKNLFIDCSASLKRTTFADGVCPCVTPTHAIYSQRLERYLGPQDFLNAQGLWRSCFNSHVYDTMLETSAQELAGNSFSSTVAQAVTLASLVCCRGAWQTAGTSCESEKPILRRLKRKQPAPEYGAADPVVVKSLKQRKKRSKYTRKVANVDSRKKAKGKRKCATIWQKEQVTRP